MKFGIMYILLASLFSKHLRGAKETWEPQSTWLRWGARHVENTKK